jgi:hypothetical protein
VARGERRDPGCRFAREGCVRIRHDRVGQGQGRVLGSEYNREKRQQKQ